MQRFFERSLLCTLILAGLAACADGGQTDALTSLGSKADAAAAASDDASGPTASSSRSEKAVVADQASGTWQRIGGERDTLTVAANTTVRYGANGSYVQKVVSGTFTATNDFFGSDPIRGVYKSVEVLTPGAATADSWQRVGGERDTITVPANSTVRYGANGAYVQKVVSGTFTATNDFFGSDPIRGVYKSVELLNRGSAASGTWQRIGGEQDTITVAANTTVRYGANGSYVQKVVSGSFVATNDFFGSDPIRGVYKSVEVLSSGSAPAPTPVAPSEPAPAPAPAPAPVPGGKVIKVGPGQAVTRIADAANIAKDGDTVEIHAGTYYGDVAVWRQNNLTLRGVGGRPVLDANGKSAQGKGIFVISGANVTVDNLEFVNAKVPDLNGAGIRMEGGSLVVRNAVFRNNEEGILTSNNATMSLEIHDSQFVGNAFAYSGGYSHAIYVGQIGRLVVQGTYFTRTQSGHLIKSRARENHILYNRITDESQGSASYEVNLPNGGVTYLIGNLIEQSANSSNPMVVSYGEEGTGAWPTHQLYVVNNTLVSRRGGSCTWLRAPSNATVKAVNNLLMGNNCRFELPAGAQLANNPTVTAADFADQANYDFRLRAGSAVRGSYVAPGSANGLSLAPARQYVYPNASALLTQPASNPGAVQSVL